MAGTGVNFVGSVTIAANTAVGLFTTTAVNSSVPLAGVWTFQGVASNWGLCQVQSATSPSTESAYAFSESETFAVGGSPTDVYIYNPSAASVTFTARFASTS